MLNKNIKFNDFLQFWLVKYVYPTYAKTTQDVYTNYVNKVFIPNLPNKKIRNITELDIKNFIEIKAKVVTNATLATYVKILKIIFNIAINLKIITANPIKNIKFKYIKNIRFLDFSKEYVQELFAIFKDTKIYYIVVLAIYTGMRRGEILALKPKDLLIGTKQLVIRRNLVQTARGEIIKKKPKNGRTRIIDLDNTTLNLLIYLCKDKNVEDYIFTNIQPNYVTNLFCKILKNSSLNKISFRDLRHIHASILITGNKACANIIIIVSQRLGHSGIKITLETYAHLMQDSQADAIKVLEEYINRAV